jgi:DNA polymerase
MLSIAVSDFSVWRAHARSLLLQRTSPDCVQWTNQSQQSLFLEAMTENPSEGEPHDSERLKVPRAFMDTAREVALYEDSRNPTLKWSILYSVLWRTVMIDRRTMSLGSDAEVQALQRMRKSVSRDKHKMKAFVRFRNVNDCGDDEYFVSWFEPEHAIVESIAPFFVKRFAGMAWSILTPRGCVHWNRETLKFSAGVARASLPETLLSDDPWDGFWRAYYCSIFNPARLKEQAMRTEMPKKYWRYLPEARCIKVLSSGSASSVQKMLDRPQTESNRLRVKSRRLRAAQDALRSRN